MSTKRPQNSCLREWCCPGRTSFFRPLVIAVIVSFSIVSLIFALWAWRATAIVTQQSVHTLQTGVLGPGTYAHVLASPTGVMDRTLPNNLIEYVGGLYSVVCATSFGHKVRITPGILPTHFPSGPDGTIQASMAVCQAGAVNAGFMFRVISGSSISIETSHNVQFL